MRKAKPREDIGIPEWTFFYWKAFHELMSDRAYVTETQFIPAGTSSIPIAKSRPLPLRWETMKAYADHNDLSRDDFSMFLKLIRGMDMEFLTIAAEQAKNVTVSEENDG